MNIFGIGIPELLMIGILALIVFGPERLPEIMGQVGRMVREFQNVTSGLTAEFQRSLQTELEPLQNPLKDLTSTLQISPPAPAPVAAPPVAVGAVASTTNGAATAPFGESTSTIVESSNPPQLGWPTNGDLSANSKRETSLDDLQPPY